MGPELAFIHDFQGPLLKIRIAELSHGVVSRYPLQIGRGQEISNDEQIVTVSFFCSDSCARRTTLRVPIMFAFSSRSANTCLLA